MGWFSIMGRFGNKFKENDYNSNHTGITINVVRPLKPILLTSDFNIQELMEADNGGRWLSNASTLTLNMIGLSGIDVAFWVNKFSNLSVKIQFENSQISFFLTARLQATTRHARVK
jgi:hypothetical protein